MSNSDAVLRDAVSRIEALEEEKAGMASDIKEVYGQLKAAGFEVKVVRALVRERKQDADELAQREALLETYRDALGDLADLPLGQAAMEQAAR